LLLQWSFSLLLVCRLLCPFLILSSLFFFFSLMPLPPPISTLFPYTTLFRSPARGNRGCRPRTRPRASRDLSAPASRRPRRTRSRSEEHTSELQSPDHLVCRLLLEKKKKNK